MSWQTVRVLISFFAVAVFVFELPIAAEASILSNVPLGGWSQTSPGGGKWDDQNTNNPGPFPNVSAALGGALLSSVGLVKVDKIDNPATSGSGLGVNFTITGQGSTSGTWSINQDSLSLGGGKVLAYFSLKAGVTWNLWEIMPDTDISALTYTNSWDTNVSGGGLVNNGSQTAGLSHISFWAIDDSPNPDPQGRVPEPASLMVWCGLALAFNCGIKRRPKF